MSQVEQTKSQWMEEQVYQLVRSTPNLPYDKEKIQLACQIQSKLWVTRSVNSLIKKGLIQKAQRQDCEVLVSCSSVLDEVKSQKTSVIEREVSSEREEIDPLSVQAQPTQEEGFGLSVQDRQVLSYVYTLSGSNRSIFELSYQKMGVATQLSKRKMKESVKTLKLFGFIETPCEKQENWIRISSFGDSFIQENKIQSSDYELARPIYEQLSSPGRKLFSLLYQIPLENNLIQTDLLRLHLGWKLDVLYAELCSLEELNVVQLVTIDGESWIRFNRERFLIDFQLKAFDLQQLKKFETIRQTFLKKKANIQRHVQNAIASGGETAPKKKKKKKVVASTSSLSLVKRNSNPSNEKVFQAKRVDGEKRIFLLDTENVFELEEELFDELDELDQVIFLLSKESSRKQMSLGLFHQLVYGPWEVNSYCVKIFKSKSDALDHALVSELTLQLFEHPDAKFYIVSKDQGFLSAIRHLTHRLQLESDTIQLIPSFYA